MTAIDMAGVGVLGLSLRQVFTAVAQEIDAENAASSLIEAAREGDRHPGRPWG